MNYWKKSKPISTGCMAWYLCKAKYFPRIVNQQALIDFKSLWNMVKILYGGQGWCHWKIYRPHPDWRYPTRFSNHAGRNFRTHITDSCPLTISIQAISYINSHEKPLAFYYFGKNRKAKEVIAKTTSGGGCINDTLIHIANHHLPFGGAGNSGMGKYHGHDSFLAFSNHVPLWAVLPGLIYLQIRSV